MKKVISLILAVIMMFSVSAFATSETDINSLMAEMNIMNGFPDGGFYPPMSPYRARVSRMRSPLAGEGSHKGSRRLPAPMPMMFNAVFTGMGFTSQNRASYSSFNSNCSLPAAAKSPARHRAVNSCILSGTTLAATEMTPTPPRTQMGTVSSSLPDQM